MANDELGVKAPTSNMVVIAASGLIIYLGLGLGLYTWLNTQVFTLPNEGMFGSSVRWAWAILWAIFWTTGWSFLQPDDEQTIAEGEFGTVWIMGYFTGVLIPSGPYWKFPSWFMRIKPLPCVNITTMYETTVLNTAGHSTTDGAGVIRSGVSEGSIVKLEAKIAFQWFVHPENVRGFLKKIHAQWGKEIDWVQAQKIQQDSWSGLVLAEIRTAAASLTYQEVFGEHLKTKTDGENSPSKVEALITVLKDESLLFQNGIWPYQVSIERVKAGTESLEKALAGEAEEGAERKRQLADAKTFHEIREANFQMLLAASWPNDSTTRQEAYKLALLQTGKMLAINPIEVSGNKSGQTSLQVNPGQR